MLAEKELSTPLLGPRAEPKADVGDVVFLPLLENSPPACFYQAIARSAGNETR